MLPALESEPFPTAPQAPHRAYSLKRLEHCGSPSPAGLLVNVPKAYQKYVQKGAFPPVRVRVHKASVKVQWPRDRDCPNPSGGGTVGRSIENMSHKSRMRLIFAFANAPEPWEWMVTLTYEKQPSHPGQNFANFLRRFKRRFQTDCQFGWVMEYQHRGVVHYHLFLGSSFIDRNGLRDSATVDRVGKASRRRTVIRGPFDDWIVSKWMAATGDTSPGFKEFQKGGIVEPMRSPEAAARYVAKDAGKKHQKRLPKGVETGNRWWYASPECYGGLGEPGWLTDWPFEDAYNTVFDKSKMEGCFILDPSADPAFKAQLDVEEPF